ncbi:MAG: hypothetical protein J6P05_02430 [Lachnospiraceae bacterium]|nr:hypothetical protein [Lachnospiraceae bacterium]
MREEGYIKDIIAVFLGFLIIMLTIIAILDKGRNELFFTVLFILGLLISLCSIWRVKSAGKLFFLPFLLVAIVMCVFCYISFKHLFFSA